VPISRASVQVDFRAAISSEAQADSAVLEALAAISQPVLPQA
jgi:hypothetical protein